MLDRRDVFEIVARNPAHESDVILEIQWTSKSQILILVDGGPVNRGFVLSCSAALPS